MNGGGMPFPRPDHLTLPYQANSPIPDNHDSQLVNRLLSHQEALERFSVSLLSRSHLNTAP